MPQINNRHEYLSTAKPRPSEEDGSIGDPDPTSYEDQKNSYHTFSLNAAATQDHYNTGSYYMSFEEK
jgi:hypothetical protein